MSHTGCWSWDEMKLVWLPKKGECHSLADDHRMRFNYMHHNCRIKGSDTHLLFWQLTLNLI